MFAISGTKLDIGYEERLILKDFDMTVRKGGNHNFRWS